MQNCVIPRIELNITQEQFDSLLDWLNHDRETAGRKYEIIRAGLLRMFVSKGFSDAEDLVDDTINRVTTRLHEIKASYQGDPIRYFYGVARNVKLETARRREITTEVIQVSSNWPPDPPDDDDEDDDHYQCLDLCLEALQAPKRDFILSYYLYDGHEKIEHHKQMAKELGITKNALRGRAHQLRSGLEACVKQCVSNRQNKIAEKIIVNDLRAGGGKSSFKRQTIS